MHCMECGAKLPQHAIHCPACGAAAPSELFMVYALASGPTLQSATHRPLGKKAVLQVLEQSPIELETQQSTEQPSVLSTQADQAPPLAVSPPTTEPLSNPVALETDSEPAISAEPAPAEIFGEEAFYQYIAQRNISHGETGYGIPVLAKPVTLSEFAISPECENTAPTAQHPQPRETIHTATRSSRPKWIGPLRSLLARKEHYPSWESNKLR